MWLRPQQPEALTLHQGRRARTSDAPIVLIKFRQDSFSGSEGPVQGVKGHKGSGALRKVDIMSVMSSRVREGFWQAGCGSLQPA